LCRTAPNSGFAAGHSQHKQAGWAKDNKMSYYIALIHKDSGRCYGVSFPDLPGVVTAGNTIDEVMQKAAEVLEFAADDWSDLTGREFPAPRSIDQLRSLPGFREDAAGAVLAIVPLRERADAAQ
jgi:predicted RNase H-like HicB family nuclease